MGDTGYKENGRRTLLPVNTRQLILSLMIRTKICFVNTWFISTLDMQCIELLVTTMNGEYKKRKKTKLDSFCYSFVLDYLVLLILVALNCDVNRFQFSQPWVAGVLVFGCLEV